MSAGYYIENLNNKLKYTLENVKNYMESDKAYRDINQLKYLNEILDKELKVYENLVEELRELMVQLKSLTKERIKQYDKEVSQGNLLGHITVRKEKRRDFSSNYNDYTEYVCYYTVTTDTEICIVNSQISERWKNSKTKSLLIDKAFIELTSTWNIHPRNIEITDLT